MCLPTHLAKERGATSPPINIRPASPSSPLHQHARSPPSNPFTTIEPLRCTVSNPPSGNGSGSTSGDAGCWRETNRWRARSIRLDGGNRIDKTTGAFPPVINIHTLPPSINQGSEKNLKIAADGAAPPHNDVPGCKTRRGDRKVGSFHTFPYILTYF